MAKEKSGKYDKLIKVLQICSIILTVVMIVVLIKVLHDHGVSLKNTETIMNLQSEFEALGFGIVKLALLVIVINFVKSFALVITPSYVFALSGLIFDKLWVAIVVNILALLTGQLMPYFLGKFTGSGMVETLKNRFPKVRKVDDFADQNGFILSFILKASAVIPGDTTSLVLGAMDIPFLKFYFGSALGTLPLCILWPIISNKGFENPLYLLWLVPIIGFAILMSFIANKMSKKKQAE